MMYIFCYFYYIYTSCELNISWFFLIWQIIFNNRALDIHVRYCRQQEALKIIVKRYTAFSDCIKHCIECFFFHFFQ